MGAGNADDTLRWIDSFELPEERKLAAQSAFGNMKAKLSEEQLVQMANTTENDSIRAMATTAVLEKTLAKDVDSAVKWVEGLPDSSKSPAQRKVAEKLALENRVSEATNLALTIQGADDRVLAMDDISRTLYSSGPQAVAKWVETLPGEAQQRAVEGLVGRWYKSDSIAVSEWINGLSAGDMRDKAISTLVSCLSDVDPIAAHDAALAIKNPRMRQTALSLIRR